MPRVVPAIFALCLSMTAVERGAAAPADRGPVRARRPVARRPLPRVKRSVFLYMWIGNSQRVSGTLTISGFVPGGVDRIAVLERVLGAPVTSTGKRFSVQRRFVPVISESFLCDGAFRRRGLVVSGRIDPRPLANALQRFHDEEFTIHVNWDSAGTFDVTPSRFLRLDEDPDSHVQFAEWKWGPGDAGELTPAEIRYGYPLRDYGGWYAAFAGVLLLPLLATLWLRQRALSASGGDRAAVWFTYIKRVQLVLVAGAITWMMLVLSPTVNAMVHFLVPSELHQVTTAVVLATMLVPTVAMNMLVAGLSYPVYSEVRGAGWSRGELVRQVLWREAVFGLPLAMGILAFAAYSDGMTRAVILWLFAAWLAWIFATRRLVAVVQPSLHVVTTGPLRDRITEMAEAAGVKLLHIFVLDASKSLDANAAAIRTSGGGKSVLVTDYLIRGLNRREVDAIVAHELAHLKGKHGGHPILVFVVCMVLAIIAGTWLTMTGRMHSDQTPMVIVPIIILLPLIWNRFRSRRQERAADRDALQYTVYPEAHVTSLVRINKQGMIPLNWSRVDETWLTHPSTQRRVERIGRHAGIPAKRVEELIREVQRDEPAAEHSPETDHYPLPEDLLRPGRVFTTQFKQSALVRNVVLFFTLFGFTPAGLLALAQRYEFAADVPVWLNVLLAAGLCWLILHVCESFLAVAGFAGMRRRLAAKLADEGFDVAQPGGRFVSFSPADGPRLYEGFTNWDVGFLLLFRDRLVYLGDQVRFALRRDQVDRMALGPSAAAPWYPKRVYMTWRNDAGNAITQNFGWVEGKTLGALRRATPQLLRTLERWHAGADQAADVPAGLSDLGPPKLGAVSSLRLQDAVNGRGVLRLHVYLSLLAAGAAYVFGLSFRWFDGAAWQAIVGSGLALLFTQAPMLLYRESSEASAADKPQSLPQPTGGDLQPED